MISAASRRFLNVRPVASMRFATLHRSMGSTAISSAAVPTLLESIQSHLQSAQADTKSSLSTSQVEKRLLQLKRHHMHYLSMEINWAQYQPEQRQEALRELEDLLTSNNYQLLEKEKQQSLQFTQSQLELLDPTRDFQQWDLLLQKNDALQQGDWKKMTLDEKKAAYYLAWGPKAEGYSEQHKAVFFRTAAFLFLASGIYFSLLKYFRSQKNLPNLSPEWRAANKERLIQERSNPYTGESAHLFTKDGIKNA